MKNSFWVFGMLAIVLIAVSFFLFAYADSKNYWKVINPLNPKFEVKKFVFNDYGSHAELAEALKILVPVGTPFEQAHKILSGPKGIEGRDRSQDADILTSATIRNKVDIDALRTKADKIITYQNGGKWKLMNPNWGGWNVTVFYDEQLKVMQIIAGSEILFDEGRR